MISPTPNAVPSQHGKQLHRFASFVVLGFAVLFVTIFATGSAFAISDEQKPHFIQASDYYPVGMGYYRGGSSLAPGQNEVKIRDGLVQTSHGVSVHRDAAKVERFGGAYAVMSIPETLKIIQRGRDQEHFEIVPAKPMPFDQYADELGRVKLSLAQHVN